MANYNINDTINIWLNDLKFHTEVEHMSILQGKSIMKINSNQKPELIKDEILSIYQKAQNICDTITFNNKEILNLQYIIDHSAQLVINVRNLIRQFSNHGFEDLKKVDLDCIRLKSLIESIRKISEEEESTDIIEYLEAIHHSVSEIRDYTIFFLIKELINKKLIFNNQVEMPTLNNIYDIIKNSSYFIKYFIEIDTIKKILDILKSTINYEVQFISVKILTILCNSKENLLQFDTETGFQIISLLLCNTSLFEDLRFECVKLLSILFYPTNLINHEYNGYLENLQDIITSMLDLICKANCNDDFLTCLSAILNLMNHDDISLEIMCEQNLVCKIVNYCKKNKDISPEIRSKIISILELLSYTESGLDELSHIDIFENILFSNLHYIIQIPNNCQPLLSYIIISSIKILNKIVNKSTKMILNIVEMDGIQLLKELIKLYPELKENTEFNKLLISLEQEIIVSR